MPIASRDVIVVSSLCECVSETAASATVRDEATPTVLCVSRPLHLLYTELTSEQSPIPVPKNGIPNCDGNLVWVPYIPQSVFHTGTEKKKKIYNGNFVLVKLIMFSRIVVNGVCGCRGRRDATNKSIGHLSNVTWVVA